MGGDAIAELAALAQRLTRAPDLAEDILGQMGEEIVDLVKSGHSGGHDPYGDQWKPKADGSDCHLFDTGNLRNGWHIVAKSATEVTVAPTAFYAVFHQGGTRSSRRNAFGGGRRYLGSGTRLPVRAMVPDGRGLPPAWQSALIEVAEKAMEHLLGK